MSDIDEPELAEEVSEEEEEGSGEEQSDEEVPEPEPVVEKKKPARRLEVVSESKRTPPPVLAAQPSKVMCGYVMGNRSKYVGQTCGVVYRKGGTRNGYCSQHFAIMSAAGGDETPTPSRRPTATKPKSSSSRAKALGAADDFSCLICSTIFFFLDGAAALGDGAGAALRCEIAKSFMLDD